MSLQLRVSGVAGEVCTLEADLSWTGRQVKDAVEAATEYACPVCTQRLLIGQFLLADAMSLGEVTASLVLEHGASSEQVLHVQLVLVPNVRIWRSDGNKAVLAKLLREFEFAPMRLDLQGKRLLLEAEESADPACIVMDKDMLLYVVDWEGIFAVRPDGIEAVLCLDGSFMMIGDGTSFAAAVLLLTSGQILAITVQVLEGIPCTGFRPVALRASLCASSLDELRQRAPRFLDASQGQLAHEKSREESDDHEEQHRHEDPIGPLQVALPDVRWPWDFLVGRNRSSDWSWVRRQSLLPFCHCLSLPMDLQSAFTKVHLRCKILNSAASELELSVEGRTRLPWADLLVRLRAALPEDEYLHGCMDRLQQVAEAAGPGATPTFKQFFESLSQVSHYPRDLVFGGRLEVDYESWKREVAVSSADSDS